MDQITINRIAHIRQQEIIEQAKQHKQKSSSTRLPLPDVLAFIRRHIGSTTSTPELIKNENTTIRDGVVQSG